MGKKANGKAHGIDRVISWTRSVVSTDSSRPKRKSLARKGGGPALDSKRSLLFIVS